MFTLNDDDDAHSGLLWTPLDALVSCQCSW